MVLGVLVSFCVQCASNSSVPKEVPAKAAGASDVGGLPTGAKDSAPDPPIDPDGELIAGALRVVPGLSDEARAAGVRRLAHIPYRWDDETTRQKNAREPIVVPIGRPTRFPEPASPQAGFYSPFGYLKQVTITRAGALRMRNGSVDMAGRRDNQGMVTVPADWDGIVQEHSLFEGLTNKGTSLLAYGELGLANYRAYVTRYLPWRLKRRDLPSGYQVTTYSGIEMRLATLMTGDIDADGTLELIAFVFVRWTDEQQATVALGGEIGVVWRDRKKEPAVLVGFTHQPGAFTIPYVVPRQLNGGTPLVYSIEYCCGSTGVRSASIRPGTYNTATRSGENGDWQIFLQPSNTGDAKLLVATHAPVDWAAPREKWAF